MVLIIALIYVVLIITLIYSVDNSFNLCNVDNSFILYSVDNSFFFSTCQHIACSLRNYQFKIGIATVVHVVENLPKKETTFPFVMPRTDVETESCLC